MTLLDFYQAIRANPWPLALLLAALPLLTLLVNLWAGPTAEQIFRWRYVYTGLVYAACIPGVFAFVLNLYLFLFERQSVWQMNLVLQLLPLLTMGLTLLLIRQKIPFRAVPGFGKISGFLTLIAALMGLLYLLDRLQLIAFVRVPFAALLIAVSYTHLTLPTICSV